MYTHGLNEPYYFILKTNNEHQDRTIYLENNTKTKEAGYEQLLSYYFAAKDTDGSSEAIMKALSIKRSYFFKIKPFIDDIRFIEVVKQYAINKSITEILEQYKVVKQALTALENSPSVDKVLKAFEDKLRLAEPKEELVSDSSKKQQKESNALSEKKQKTYVPIKIPNEQSKFQKLFFEDVREWSKLDIEDFDLKSDKGLKKYLAALVDELSE